MLKSVTELDSPCERCHRTESVLLEDTKGDTMVLCHHCALLGLMTTLQDEKVCKECGGTGTKIIKCLDRTTQEIINICLPCANKRNKEALK